MVTTAKLEGRDAAGRFTAGNTLSRGRPRRERETEFLDAFCGALPASELAEVTKAILARAKAGNIPAARLLLEYAVGKPTTRIEFAPSDEEYRVAGKSPAEGMAAMMERIAAKVKERREYEDCVKKTDTQNRSKY
ncbi:MAG: hypothetical protein GXP26_04995 [Planctomycetes bacterium]|nr:hypothetical protein [Planctomycetota bacterium]